MNTIIYTMIDNCLALFFTQFVYLVLAVLWPKRKMKQKVSDCQPKAVWPLALFLFTAACTFAFFYCCYFLPLFCVH